MGSRRRLTDSFRCAADGVVHALRTQRNMRVHFALAVAALVAALLFQLSTVELALVFVSISFVIAAELFNTAVEAVVDLVSPQYHPLARIAKDTAAAAVLLAAINALVVGYFVFLGKIDPWMLRGLQELRRDPVYVTFIALGLTMAVGFIGKSRHRVYNYFQGGMPSIHAAVAFCLATAIGYITWNGMATLLAFLLAGLVAQSRVEGGIHTLGEVVAGAVLGVAVAAVLFSLIQG
ncbi:diacylglycerol kinase [Kyrpidia spormannii]|uniref:Diacylglycerol kinase n=1 Tax=Kyrpidia spormannii TaxID=2055160 RepID=A0A6F9E6I3_9BACL|nr:diacylglycerol kinase [Kyrpidia spormannii]CAB3392127.1 Diacylglycerol kinase [Kyrpidia spormannii]